MLKYILFFILLSLAKSLIAQPAITSFTPMSGPVGTTVTINVKGKEQNNDVFIWMCRYQLEGEQVKI